MSIAQEIGDREGEGDAYGNLGAVYQSLNKFKRAIEYHKKSLSIAQEIGNREGEGIAYGNLGSAYNQLSEFQKAMEYNKKYLSLAKKINDRTVRTFDVYLNLGAVSHSLGDVPRAMKYYKEFLSNAEEIGDRNEQRKAYCSLGSGYKDLHDFKEAIECYKQQLSISKEIGDRMAEACAHRGLGHSLLESHSLNEALEHFRCCVKICDTIRANSISEDQLKISFCTSHQCAYTHLWQVLVMLQRNDEALYAAERGRAQALLDALKVTYGLTSLSPRSIESEEEVKYLSMNTAVLTVFFALELKKVNMWVLRKEGNPIFRKAEFEIGGAHEDSFALLLDTALKKMRAGVGIRCENRSMDKMSDDQTSTTRDDDQTSEPIQGTTDLLQPLYDVALGPIEDLLDGDELIVVPDGALSKAPWAALSET